jgi:hypothetical protein
VSVDVQAFLLCKSHVIQEGSRLNDILGIFDSIRVDDFPAIADNYTLFIKIVVLDEAVCRMAVMMESPSLQTRQILGPLTVKPDPNGKVQVDCKITKLALEEQGIYTLNLVVNEKKRSTLHLTATKRRRPGVIETPLSGG